MKESTNVPPSGVRNNLWSTRPTLSLFRAQPLRETGQSTYGFYEHFDAILSGNEKLFKKKKKKRRKKKRTTD